MKLSALLSDGLMLQRGKENVIWGSECIEGQKIEVYIKCEEDRSAEADSDGADVSANAASDVNCFDANMTIAVKTTADSSGNFKVTLPEIPAGGPYTLKINDYEINNVMCGDVYLLSGQSNMELPVNRTLDMYEDIVKTINYPDIHYFEVPKEYRFDRPSDDIYAGSWVSATNDNIYDMSALGLFYAQLAERDEGVPIGLIQTGVGGAHIESFISEERILSVGKRLREKASKRGEDISTCSCTKNDCCKVCYEYNLTRNKDAAFVSKTNADELAAQTAWTENINKKDPGLAEHWENKKSLYDVGDENYVNCPGLFEKLTEHAELEDVQGVIWLLKTVNIPKHWIDKEVRLYLGTLVDSDDTYVNGVFVGRTEYRYPPRRYKIPAGVLREGENTIVIRLVANARPGGFMPEAPYYLSLGDEKIAIDGKWQYKVSAMLDMSVDKELEDITFFTWKPTALYNQMLYPLRNLRLNGILFYQGESNANHAADYEDLMIEMSDGLRELFNDNLPIGFIKLPMFGGEGDSRGSSEWDDLRDAQGRAAERIDNCVIADIYDLGFKYELHPQNKMEVAKRLYNAMKGKR